MRVVLHANQAVAGVRGADHIEHRTRADPVQEVVVGDLVGPADRLTLHFLTPLKLTHEGRLVRRFSFAEIARVLMRRVSSLSYYYSGADLPLDYRWLSQAATKVQTATSDCRLEIWSGRPAGLVGSTTFVGDLEPFHLLLQAGSAAHLGKGASFGFGSYQLEA